MKRILLSILFSMPLLLTAQWTQLGTFLEGEAPDDRLGFRNKLSIDSSGTTIAVGTPRNSTNGYFFGYAKVFDWDGTSWTQRGNTFEGTATTTFTGESVSLSDDGLTVAIASSEGVNSAGDSSGIVRVFDWNGSMWTQRGGNIEGEGNSNPQFEKCEFGFAISLSSSGNHLIVGAPENTPQVGSLEDAGHARVFEWDGQNWVQMGQDLDGLTAQEEFGVSVDISSDGSIIAIGSTDYDQDKGVVRAYEWNGSVWNLRGSAIVGSEFSQALGRSVSLSEDGNVLAIGSSAPVSSSPSKVQVFEWSGTNWMLRGNDILGAVGSQAGSSVDLSEDGNIVAIGEPLASNSGGQTRVMQWDGNAWSQIDNTILSGGFSAGWFGTSVSISNDGVRVAAGAPFYDGNFNNSGRVYVFENTATQPTALFTLDDPACANGVTFTDQSAGATSWNWDFGLNATPQTATGSGPHSVVFNSTASQSISLTVTNVAGSDTYSTMVQLDSLPSLAFTWTNPNGLYVEFTNTTSNADSYLWNFGDGSQSILPDPVYTYSTAGTYNVTLEATNDCGTSNSQQELSVEDSLNGVEQISMHALKVYPNPTNGLVNIQSDHLIKDLKLRILSISGQTIISSEILTLNTGDSKTIDLNELSSGIYFLEAHSTDLHSRTRLIVN